MPLLPAFFFFSAFFPLHLASVAAAKAFRQLAVCPYKALDG